MSTYVISDIHGHLKLLKKMLKLIDFKYDGTDSLYLLGDYVDWGPNSIDTILFIMELNKKYEFIHPLIGNHDLMMLEQIDYYNKNPKILNYQWLTQNKGDITFQDYLKRDKETQKEIRDFIDSLPYQIDIIVNNKKYIAAHACPVDKSRKSDLYTPKELRKKAVWERITRKVFNVIKWYDDNNEYENFICGHTITRNLRKTHYCIINEPHNFINIDCGCKIIGCLDNDDAQYARLAALRIDDMKEFYVK